MLKTYLVKVTTETNVYVSAEDDHEAKWVAIEEASWCAPDKTECEIVFVEKEEE